MEFAKIDEHGDDDELDSDLDVDEHDNCDSSDSDSLNFDRELKIRTELDFNGRSILLRFPKSRLGRKKSKDLDDSSKFLADEFKRRVKNEYNNHPVGQYMGPYDQPKDLSLSAQLPNSKLDFERYTQFYHNGTTCYNYKIGNYKKYKALEKIDSYQIDSEKECNENNSEEDDVNIYYTCQHKKCKIPCPCAHCCSEMVQCTEHKLEHPSLFDEVSHAVTIRSSEPFCVDESFFNKSYIIKYSGIPLKCKKCKRDLVNHNSYHFEYHTDCRFCNPTFFKAKATSEKHLRFLIKDEEEYYKTVCQYCDRKFCQAYFVKKHIEAEHGVKPFKCTICDQRFQSDKAKSYHEKVVHSDTVKTIDCGNCGKNFQSEVHLKAHQKYVHSEIRKHICKTCGSKFKQKKDLKVHLLNKHDLNNIKEDYDEKSDTGNGYKCESAFRYKKNLNAQVRSNHLKVDSFPCTDCDLIIRNKRSLVRHKKTKPGPNETHHVCPLCKKDFSDKITMKEHEKFHYAKKTVDS